MITIRSSKAGSKATLICMEATLKTPRNVYTISSNDPMTDLGSSFGDGLFGAISWPVSRFRLREGLLLEQQMFLPHDRSTAAFSWTLPGDAMFSAQLVVRPFFSGCGPRSYRDLGFHFDSEEIGGRLAWLPNVRGPKMFADTNGRYYNEPVRVSDRFCDDYAASASAEHLITPGRFEFELGRRPAVLIFSNDDHGKIQRNQHIGVFLAGLMKEDSPSRAGSIIERLGVATQQGVIP